jgi:hypothetical protein
LTIALEKQLIKLLARCAFVGTTLLAGSNVLLVSRVAADSASTTTSFSLTKYTPFPAALNFPAITGAPAKNNEIPPVAMPMPTGASVNYFAGGYMSFSCLGNWALFGSGIHAFSDCSEVLGPVVDNIQTGYITEAIADQRPAYKRNYNGIFSVVKYNDTLLAVMHGENKGEAHPKAGGGVGLFRNSVSRSITNLLKGDTGCTCVTEPNGCYFAFVSAATIPYTQKTGYGHKPQWTDHGPIVWPSRGYVSPGNITLTCDPPPTPTLKVANGPRHPHAIIVGEFVYVFYVDSFYTTGSDGLYNLDVGDRRGGMKVIRAQLPNVGPGNWYAYYEPEGAAGDFTEPALPGSDFSIPGPRATPLFPNNKDRNPKNLKYDHGNYEGFSFAVAQVRGQNLYVGVEQYQDWGLEGPLMCEGKMRVALRTSTDILHWSNRIPLYDGCQDYANFALNLPEFVDASSTSNTQIDLNDFYIVGNKPFSYFYMHVGLTALPATPLAASSAPSPPR